MKKIIHCCKEMDDNLKRSKNTLQYCPVSRQFLTYTWYGGKYFIYFCPWCTKKLPKELRKTYYKVLEEEYKIEYPDRAEDAGTLPEEFKTDLWWRKRGL